MSKKIVCAGHVCIDITPNLPIAPKHVSEVLVPSTTVTTRGVTISLGGVVSSTGIGLKIMGADVAYMGKLGDDSFGKILLDIFRQYDPSAMDSLIVDKNVSTSFTIVLAVPGNDRIFLHDPGANEELYYEDFDYDVIRESALFHFGYPPFMKQFYLNDGKELVHLYKTVKELGVATSMDMTILDPDSPTFHLDWPGIIRRTMPYLDIFAPSFEELASMIDLPRFERLSKESPTGDIADVVKFSDAKALGDMLIDWGARIVLIKCGAPGLYLRTGSKERIAEIGGGFIKDPAQWADIECFEESYQPEQVLSGTGAGDTTIAAFLKAITDGYDYKTCLQLATATGASCVEAYDSLSGLKTFDELFAKINAGWKKNKWKNIDK